MKKSSLKLCFGTCLLTLTLASFGLAGDSHCPLTDPPPGDGENGRLAIPITCYVNPALTGGYQILQSFWELLAHSTDLSK